jgi:hypothetical protein
MTPQPDRYEWVSVHEASRRLNRSTSTIRRMIESGELVGEREPLAKGSNRDRYRVRLDATVAPGVTPHDAPPSESPDAPGTPQEAPAAITGLLALVADERARSDQLNLDLRVQAQVIGRLTAERDVARADLAAARAELVRLTEAQERRRWWRFWQK